MQFFFGNKQQYSLYVNNVVFTNINILCYVILMTNDLRIQITAENESLLDIMTNSMHCQHYNNCLKKWHKFLGINYKEKYSGIMNMDESIVERFTLTSLDDGSFFFSCSENFLNDFLLFFPFFQVINLISSQVSYILFCSYNDLKTSLVQLQTLSCSVGV